MRESQLSVFIRVVVGQHTGLYHQYSICTTLTRFACRWFSFARNSEDMDRPTKVADGTIITLLVASLLPSAQNERWKRRGDGGA